MRRCPPRILLNSATGFSLLLCVASVALWARSYWVYDYVERQDRTTVEVRSNLGRIDVLVIHWGDRSALFGPPGWRAFPLRPLPALAEYYAASAGVTRDWKGLGFQ